MLPEPLRTIVPRVFGDVLRRALLEYGVDFVRQFGPGIPLAIEDGVEVRPTDTVVLCPATD